MSTADTFWCAWIALSVVSIAGLLLSRRTRKTAPRNRMDPYAQRWAPAVHDNEQRRST